MTDLKDILTISQIISAIVTPLVVLILGLQINRRLEHWKLSLSKEKEWQTKWAESFFSSASGFNQAVEDSIMRLYTIAYYDPSEAEKLVRADIEKIQRMEWSLKTHVQYAPKNREKVQLNASKVMELITQLLHGEVRDLELIREALFEFNAASKEAHRELLAL